MNSPVDQIKERLSIEDVVSSYIKLDKAGSNLKAKCPFHNEKTPSFFISPARRSYYCFGCAASGDIFTFVEEFEGLDFKGALKLLADRAGVALTPYNKEAKENQSEKEKLYEAMEESTKFFENNLKKNKEVLEYLKSRGLSEKSIQDFRIGYISPDWRQLHSHLKKKGFTDTEIEKAGLAKKTEKGYYDRFRGRVMFPISDSSGRIIAFSGRLFVDDQENDQKSAKYLNSPDTPIFNKSAVLYGLDKAKDSIRKNNFSILVEGQMDLVLSHQAGYRNTVATSGTALSDVTTSKENVVSNLGLVRRLSDNIVLAFDGDSAGFKASQRAGKIALSLGMDVKVAKLEAGYDPADVISKRGPDAWKEAVRGSKHIIEFILGKILEDVGEDARKAGREIEETLLPYVSSLASSIEKMHFIKKISDVSGVAESALQDDFKKLEKEANTEKREIEEIKKAETKVFRKDYILRKLLGIAFWQREMKGPDLKVDSGALLKELAEITQSTEEEILNKAMDNKEDLIFEAEVFYSDDAGLKKDVEELLGNLREEFLKEELAGKMRELSLAEEEKDMGKGRNILQEIHDINNKIHAIKNKQNKQ